MYGNKTRFSYENLEEIRQILLSVPTNCLRQDDTLGSRWVSLLQLNSVTAVQKFSKKLEVSYKFEAPKVWHEPAHKSAVPVILVVFWRFLLGQCEMIHIFVRTSRKQDRQM